MEWKKLHVLGEGHFGKVYYAKRKGFSLLGPSIAAIKSADLQRSSSLQREARVLKTLRGSSKVVKYYGKEVTTEKGVATFNLVLEYACGGSLHDLIRSKIGTLSEVEMGYYVYQILKGIRDVHNKGWIHCDIKPANILLFGRNDNRMHKLKLADFGVSLSVDEGNKTGNPLSNRGDLHYAPPESLTCGLHVKAYDIWSLGCTVAEMLAGHIDHVWNHHDVRCLQRKIMKGNPEIPSNTSQIARDFMHKCFIKDPKRRWTAEQLLQHPLVYNKYY